MGKASKTSSTKELFSEAEKLEEAGRFADAVLIYKQITINEPENADALYSWACIAYERGSLNNAEKLLKRAIKVSKGHVPALCKLGAVYFQYGWYGWAIGCFREVIEYDPSYLAAYSNLAKALNDTAEPWQAEEICLKGFSIDKNYIPLYVVYAQALRMQNKAMEAIKSLEKLLKLSDAPQAADFCHIGSVYSDIGDKKKAAQFFKKALQTDPEYADAHYLLSNVHKYKKGDAHISDMEALLSRLDKNSYEAQRLHFALGRAYDKCGDQDEAFTHYAQGNYLKRAEFKYDIDSTRKNFKGLKKVFKAGFEKSALRKRKKGPVPIFIVGMPRSGTTLTEQILFSHPKVKAAGETIYLDRVQAAHRFTYFKEYDEDVKNLPKDALNAMRDEYIEKLIRHAPEAEYITDKMPVNFRFIGLIRLLFPEAKIIHCRRDPMDSCFSIYKRTFTGFFPFSYNLEELGKYYCYYEDLMAFWHKRLPGFILDVQYESLIDDQEAQTRKILEFCGLPWDPACLEFHKKDRSIMTASTLQVRKPLYKNAIGSWKKYGKHLNLLKKELGKFATG